MRSLRNRLNRICTCASSNGLHRRIRSPGCAAQSALNSASSAPRTNAGSSSPVSCPARTSKMNGHGGVGEAVSQRKNRQRRQCKQQAQRCRKQNGVQQLCGAQRMRIAPGCAQNGSHANPLLKGKAGAKQHGQRQFQVRIPSVKNHPKAPDIPADKSPGAPRPIPRNPDSARKFPSLRPVRSIRALLRVRFPMRSAHGPSVR